MRIGFNLEERQSSCVLRIYIFTSFLVSAYMKLLLCFTSLTRMFSAFNYASLTVLMRRRKKIYYVGYLFTRWILSRFNSSLCLSVGIFCIFMRVSYLFMNAKWQKANNFGLILLWRVYKTYKALMKYIKFCQQEKLETLKIFPFYTETSSIF